MKSNKGITLISLISTIILIIILTSVTTATSIHAYNQMKFEGAKSELEEVQKQAGQIISDYSTYKKEVTDPAKQNYIDFFKARYNQDFTTNLITSFYKNEIHNLITKYPTTFTDTVSSAYPIRTDLFYFNSDDLAKYFELKGIDPVVVDFSKRKVYSVKGIKDPDSGEIYYTPEDWGVENDFNVSEENSDTYTITATKVSNRDVNITIKPNITNSISKVYISDDSSNYVETDNYRILSNDSSGTVIRISLNEDIESSSYSYYYYSGPKYGFKIVDDMKNNYIIDNKSF